jgi:hypothetical protein
VPQGSVEKQLATIVISDFVWIVPARLQIDKMYLVAEHLDTIGAPP